MTKLSQQIYNPLELVGPIIIQAKILMQSLWKAQLEWNESVPLEIYSDWMLFRSNLEQLAIVKISHRILTKDIENTELYGFFDASEKTYGACVCLRQ